MIVKIYKNCKLNNKYKDVFFNKTFLDTYLGTLDSKTIINDSDLFSRNNDKLLVDDANIPDFKQYNYLKIEDSIGTFYAFINNIEWVSEIYTIYYEEDILSNYFEYVHIRNSLLTANKSLKLDKGNNQRNINYYKLPIDVETNDYVNMTVSHNIKNRVCVVGKIQLYKLTQQNVPNSRIPLLILFSHGNDVLTQSYEFYRSGVIDSFINGIINKKSDTQITYNGEQYYYDIDKLYAIPYDFFLSSIIQLGSQFEFITIDNVKYFAGIMASDNYLGKWQEYTETINYDRKIDSIGLFSTPISVLLNGTDISVKIITYVRGYGFSIIMNVQNKIVDITENFIIELPFTQVSSSELQLQRLQLELQNNNINNKIDIANNEIDKNKLRNFQDTGFSAVDLLFGMLGKPSLSPMNTIKDITERQYDTYQKEINIGYMSYEQSLINRKMYSTTKIVNNKFSYINAVFGLVVFLKNEDNTLQIEQAIKLSGYIVREVVNDVIQNLDTEHLTDNYDVFKFDEVNLYGVIAQDYLRVIERVLLNGVRVWCQGNIGEVI